MGKYFVSKQHLSALIQEVTKDKHHLTAYDLEGKDKMNFESINKLSDNRVLELPKDREDATGTRYLLKITRYILDAFLIKSLSNENRVYNIWYVVFFLRIWRYWLKEIIKEKKEFSLKENWLTSNSYTGIELNAHGLLILLVKCHEKSEQFLPWLYSSQPCEKFFRQTRSMTTTNSTIVNFDMLDLLYRRNRIQAIDDIVADSDDSFVFAREKNSKMGTSSRSEATHRTTSLIELRIILEQAEKDAIMDTSAVGMLLREHSLKEALATVSLTLHYSRGLRL
ncbi:uncharacterized protein LOC123307068 [Coccinella septempunctata]|uniref:uncharacterized protein LOC123307068 n=1 Tax=Coccinella septempunctata TaxID=41139 RepID=UPI001D07D006|nr:uncharacterized protein LOC123307068 [Coccinella septempunctata]